MKDNGIFNKVLVFLIPRLGEVFFVAIFAACIGLGPRMMNIDGDIGRHITLGDYVIDNAEIPTADPFSFTKGGDPLTPHEWLSDVLFALVHRLAGLDGVVWLTALVIAGSFWLVYKYSLNLSNMGILALMGAILGAAASSFHWLTRPHIFTILLTAIWTGELEKLRLGIRKSWFVFPLLMLLWVNLHGAFIAGLLIWVCYFVGMLFDRQISMNNNQSMVWIGLSSFMISLANPDGFGIWKTGFGFLGNHYLVSHTAEYLPPDFQLAAFWPYLLLVLSSIFILGLTKKQISFSHLFLVGGWTVMSLYSARNIPLYAAAVIPILIGESAGIAYGWQGTGLVDRFLQFQGKISTTEKELRGGLWSLISIILVLVLFLAGYQLDFQKQGNRFSEDVFPVGAAAWLEQNPPEGNGFNYFPWGGYLLYTSWPQRSVFIDGQTDFYGEELTREYERVITVSEGWQGILEKYNIRWVIMPRGSALAEALDSLDSWEEGYRDGTAGIWFYTEAED